jgi:hypothetical protein
MNNPKTLARIAGGLYLLLAILGGWAQLAARASIYIPGDAAATANNIVANETLFRLSIAADIGMALSFVLLGLALHRLLAPENAAWATRMLVFISVAAGSILVNLTFQVGALIVATDPAYASLGDELSLLLLDLHHYGYILIGIFFGLWLLPIGMIALRSPLFHRAVGVVVVIGAIAWLFDPVLSILLPSELTIVRDLVSIPTVVAELGLIGYLLIVGVRTAKE